MAEFRLLSNETCNLVKEIHADKVGQAPQVSLHTDIYGWEVQFCLFFCYLPLLESTLLALEECLFKIHPLIVPDFSVA